MYYWFRRIHQFMSCMGHDQTRVEFVGNAEVQVHRSFESRGNCDTIETVRAWSVEPFVAVLINEWHDRESSVTAEESRLLPEGGDICDVPAEYSDSLPE